MSRYFLKIACDNEEKIAWSKPVGVMWCDIHKEWYLKDWLSQWELIQSNLIERHFIQPESVNEGRNDRNISWYLHSGQETCSAGWWY